MSDVQQFEKRLDALETQLADNTKKTNEIHEIVVMGKSLFKLAGTLGNAIKWMAGVAASIAALWAAWVHLFERGPKP